MGPWKNSLFLEFFFFDDVGRLTGLAQQKGGKRKR